MMSTMWTVAWRCTKIGAVAAPRCACWLWANLCPFWTSGQHHKGSLAACQSMFQASWLLAFLKKVWLWLCALCVRI